MDLQSYKSAVVYVVYDEKVACKPCAKQVAESGTYILVLLKSGLFQTIIFCQINTSEGISLNSNSSQSNYYLGMYLTYHMYLHLVYKDLRNIKIRRNRILFGTFTGYF